MHAGPSSPAEGPNDDAALVRRPSRKRTEGHVGNALRSVYDEAVREDVPDEFLDLLKKLS